MQDGEQLKYGWVGGGKAAVPLKMGTSQRIDAPGGQFVRIASGLGTYLTDGSDTVFGAVEAEYGTLATSQVVNCIVDLSAYYRVPILSGDGTYAITDIGDTCDVGVTSYVQGVHLQTNADDIFICMGGDLDNNNWALIRINPNEQGQTGSA